jgi:CDP-diacylglycerol--serine O-phosphatidyltransferase
MRLARINNQSTQGADKRYFYGLQSTPAAALPAATVFAFPAGLTDYRQALPALAVMVVPALLMVSTVRFRSFKTIDLQARRPYTILFVIAVALVLVTVHPRYVLLAAAYVYILSPFAGMTIMRVRRRSLRRESAASDEASRRNEP